MTMLWLTDSAHSIAIMLHHRSQVWQEFLACTDSKERARLFAAWNCVRHSIEHVQRTEPRRTMTARKPPAPAAVAQRAAQIGP